MSRERITQECQVVPSFLPVRNFSEHEIALLMWSAAVSYALDDEDVAAAKADDLTITQPLHVVR